MDADVEDSIKWVAKGAGIVIVGTFISKAIMYFYRILVAQELGPEAYGVLSLGLAVFWVCASISNLSLPAGVKRFVSKFIGTGEESKIRGVYVSALQLTLPAAFLAATVLFLTAPFIEERFFNTDAFSQDQVVLFLRLFAVAVPFQVLYQITNAVVVAHKRMEYMVLADKIYRSLSTLLVTALLIFLGYGLFGAVAAQLFAIVTVSFLIVYLLQTRVFPVLSSSGTGFRNHRSLFFYSYPLMLSGMIGLITGWTDTLMLGWFDTATNVGIYNAALPTAQLLAVVGGAFSSILFPVVSTMYAKGKKEQSVEVTATAVKWIFSFSFPFVIIMILFSDSILRFLFGSTYAAGAIALGVLSAAYFMHTVMSYAMQFIKTEERTRLVLFNSLVIAILNFGLNIYLIPLYSQTGAGIATAASLALGGILAVVETWYFFGVQPYRVRKIFPAFLSTVISIGIVYGGVKLFYDYTPPRVMIPALILFVLLYGILFIITGGLQGDDILVLKAMERRSGVDMERAKRVVKKLSRR